MYSWNYHSKSQHQTSHKCFMTIANMMGPSWLELELELEIQENMSPVVTTNHFPTWYFKNSLKTANTYQPTTPLSETQYPSELHQNSTCNYFVNFDKYITVFQENIFENVFKMLAIWFVPVCLKTDFEDDHNLKYDMMIITYLRTHVPKAGIKGRDKKLHTTLLYVRCNSLYLP